MTDRAQQILKRLLQALANMDGILATETMLHATIVDGVIPKVTLAEFETALRFADNRQFIIGVVNATTGKTRWKIADAGIAALLEL